MKYKVGDLVLASFFMQDEKAIIKITSVEEIGEFGQITNTYYFKFINPFDNYKAKSIYWFCEGSWRYLHSKLINDSKLAKLFYL